MAQQLSKDSILWSGKLSDTCFKCLLGLIETTVTEATCDEELKNRAKESAIEVVKAFQFNSTMSPANIANKFHPLIKSICGNEDPFKARKVKEIRFAKAVVHKYPPPYGDLERLLIYSLIGNSIDFFKDMAFLEESLIREPSIAINDLDSLMGMLKSGHKKIVLLADNAGEVYFDIPLLNFLEESGHKVYYALKGAPVQNDLAFCDFVEADIEGIRFSVVSTGADSVGLELERASSEFLDLYNSADVVIAKGMGHFETLGLNRDERLFYLFRAKCVTVANTIGVAVDDFVIMQGIRSFRCPS